MADKDFTERAKEMAAKDEFPLKGFAYLEWWVGNAFQFDFGTSWRVATGFSVGALMAEAIPATTALILLAMVPLLVGSIMAATEVTILVFEYMRKMASSVSGRRDSSSG